MDEIQDYFLNSYNTPLPEELEPQFQQWLFANSVGQNRDLSMDLVDYDLRGYWLNGGFKQELSGGHLPDTYKKPNHLTFSTESIYHGADSPFGGKFEGGSWGKDYKSFTPGNNLFLHGPERLQKYFMEKEPGVKLTLP